VGAPALDTEAPRPDQGLPTDISGSGPGVNDDISLDHALVHELSLAQGSTPYSVPGALDSHRWPGLRDAIAACNAAVRAYNALPGLGAGERYLYLADLGRLPETGWTEKDTLALQKVRAAEAQLCKWGNITLGQLRTEKRPRLGVDGAIQWKNLLVDDEDVAAWENVRAGMTVEPLNESNFMAASSMDRMVDAATKHREGMAIIRHSLGLDVDGGNPTVRGRTWLVQWPVVEAAGEEGTRMRNEAGLVVAAPGAVLLQGASLLLTTARDLGSDDADLYPTMLSSFTLRLNEEQRLAWGPAMHRCGRVFWAIQHEGEAKPIPKAKTKIEKPGRKKVEKPEPPDD